MSEERNYMQEYVDVDSALARIRGNKKLYIKMLGLFLKSDEFDKFETFISSNDLIKAAESAHTIKGMTGNLSLNKLFIISEELVVQLRQGSPDEETLASYRDIVDLTITYVKEVISQMEE